MSVPMAPAATMRRCFGVIADAHDVRGFPGAWSIEASSLVEQLACNADCEPGFAFVFQVPARDR
jgi:hypothetical protein